MLARKNGEYQVLPESRPEHMFGQTTITPSAPLPPGGGEPRHNERHPNKAG